MEKITEIYCANESISVKLLNQLHKENYKWNSGDSLLSQRQDHKYYYLHDNKFVTSNEKNPATNEQNYKIKSITAAEYLRKIRNYEIY